MAALMLGAVPKLEEACATVPGGSRDLAWIFLASRARGRFGNSNFPHRNLVGGKARHDNLRRDSFLCPHRPSLVRDARIGGSIRCHRLLAFKLRRSTHGLTSLHW
jgi:hypothetical protein